MGPYIGDVDVDLLGRMLGECGEVEVWKGCRWFR